MYLFLKKHIRNKWIMEIIKWKIYLKGNKLHLFLCIGPRCVSLHTQDITILVTWNGRTRRPIPNPLDNNIISSHTIMGQTTPDTILKGLACKQDNIRTVLNGIIYDVDAWWIFFFSMLESYRQWRETHWKIDINQVTKIRTVAIEK